MTEYLTSLLGILSAAAIVLSIWAAYQVGARRARRSAEDLSVINDIGLELLRAKLDLEDLCELVYRQAAQIVPTTTFQIGLFEGDSYHLIVWIEDGERLPSRVYPGAAKKGLVGWVREEGASLLVKDYVAEQEKLPATPAFYRDDPPGSGLFVPLIAGDDTIGVIAIQSRQTGYFSKEHERLLTALANQAASSIRNAQLYTYAEHRAEQLNLIGQISAQLSSVQPLPDFFNQVVTLIQSTFGYYAVSIVVLDETESRLLVGASTTDAFQGIDTIKPGMGLIGWAAEQGKTALANDVAHDTRYRKLGVLPETQSEIALPLLIESRTLGVLDVQSDRIDAFTPEAIKLMETLASQIALAIDQAQAYTEELALSQRLEALVQVSQTIVSVLDLDDLLDRLVELIAETFDFQRVHIFVRLGDALVFRAGTGAHSIRWLIDELQYEMDEAGLIPLVARSLSPVRIGDIKQSSDYMPGEGVEDTRSEMAVPIQMVGRVMGVLDVQSVDADAFSEEDLVLMQSLADSVAVALRNAALYANERRRRNLADALREVSSSLAAQLDLDDIVIEILEGMHRVVMLRRAAVFILDENIQLLTVYSSTGTNLRGYSGYRRRYDPAEFSDEQLAKATIQSTLEDVHRTDEETSLNIVPLIIREKVIGYVAADQPLGWQHLTEDSEMVSAFATQAAIAISNGRLYSAQQAEAYVTTALLQVAESVNAQTDTELALENVSRLTALLAGVSHCLVLSWDADLRAYTPRAHYGIVKHRFEEASRFPLFTDDHPLLDFLSVTDRPLGAGQGHQLPVPVPLKHLIPQTALLCLPLIARRGTVGLLVVDEPRQNVHPRLLSILTGIAHQTATILETASLQTGEVERERLEQELEVARSIQASFIPDELPQLEGWEIAAHWRSARQVSGDFYDFIPLGDGLWGILIADVADKGTPAALFMAVCRTLMRAASVSRRSPAETLIRVNELLFSDAPSDLFVTMFYAVWNPAAGELTCASAGHNPALLVRGTAEGRPEELRLPGIALGVIPDISLEESTIKLNPGDTLVAYTDGITEAMQADYTEYGLNRFEESLAVCRNDSASDMLATVLNDISDFVGDAPQSDDLTLWLLKRKK